METNKDHDLLIKIDTKQDLMSQDIKDLRDGTKKEITMLFERTDKLEKKDIEIENEMKGHNGRLSALEERNKDTIAKKEDKRSYLGRKALEYFFPLLMLLIGLLLAKAGILNI